MLKVRTQAHYCVEIGWKLCSLDKKRNYEENEKTEKKLFKGHRTEKKTFYFT